MDARFFHTQSTGESCLSSKSKIFRHDSFSKKSHPDCFLYMNIVRNIYIICKQFVLTITRCETLNVALLIISKISCTIYFYHKQHVNVTGI